jgi:sigma-B regulation protein RsbU (phosphoserine phosphatase)
MAPGDVLVMLTDGFFEHARAGDGEQFGIERLTSTLKQHASGSAAQVITALDGAVREFAAGAAQTDDMTAVVIKRT